MTSLCKGVAASERPNLRAAAEKRVSRQQEMSVVTSIRSKVLAFRSFMRCAVPANESTTKVTSSMPLLRFVDGSLKQSTCKSKGLDGTEVKDGQPLRLQAYWPILESNNPRY